MWGILSWSSRCRGHIGVSLASGQWMEQEARVLQITVKSFLPDPQRVFLLFPTAEPLALELSTTRPQLLFGLSHPGRWAGRGCRPRVPGEHRLPQHLWGSPYWCAKSGVGGTRDLALDHFSGLSSLLPSVTELVASHGPMHPFSCPEPLISFSLGPTAFAVLEHCYVFSRSLSPQERAKCSCCGLPKYPCFRLHRTCHTCYLC